MPENFSVSDNFSRSEKNSEPSDKYDSRSKFISGATISENPLTSQDWKFSEKTSHASMAVSLGDRAENISQNLCPRQHMDIFKYK